MPATLTRYEITYTGVANPDDPLWMIGWDCMVWGEGDTATEAFADAIDQLDANGGQLTTAEDATEYERAQAQPYPGFLTVYCSLRYDRPDPTEEA